MTQIGLKYADILILTADNPRHEPVADILGDMIAELSVEDMQKIHIQAERRKAIKFALENLGTGDILLIAGRDMRNIKRLLVRDIPLMIVRY